MTRPRNAMAPLIAAEAEDRYGHYIREALTTEGGHLAIGRGGFTLSFARGAYLSGHDCETIKTACIAAGLPVIDSRALPFEVVCDLAVRGPMVAVGELASPPPWGAFSYAPLAAVADAYRAAGAEVWNLPVPAESSLVYAMGAMTAMPGSSCLCRARRQSPAVSVVRPVSRCHAASDGLIWPMDG